MALSYYDGRATALHLNRSSKRRAASRRLVFEEVEHRSMLSANLGTQTADEAAVGDSIDSFGLDLYAQLQSTTGGNLFVSPFSIAAALDMTYAGARGETAQQMANVLHLGADPGKVESDFGELLKDLNGAGQTGGYLLSVANALWTQQGLAVLPEFLNVVQSDFDGGLKQVDFVHDAEAARQTINDWAAQQTNGKIQDLFPKGSLDNLTRLVLADAIYFNGKWATAFDPSQTYDAPFNLASGSQITASTMHRLGSLPYMQSDGFQVLELPYADGRLAMDILLPTQSGLAGLDSSEIPVDLNGWLKGLGEQEVAVSLPKFEMTTQFALNAPLKALGMTDAFSPNADFSGVTDAANVHVSGVFHKAFISVDETGTEAAAATGGGESIAGAAHPFGPVIFNADHPFIFLIRDTQSGSVLFMGQVENPTQQGSDPSAAVITHQPRGQNPIAQDPIGENPIPQPPAPSPLPVPVGTNPPLIGPIYNPPIATVPLPANEQWLDAVYGKLLGRAPEPGAVAYWSAQSNGGSSHASVVSDIEASSEFRRSEVEAAYQQFLGRTGDAAGLDFYSGKLAAGATIEQVDAALAGSSEFFQLHGGTNNAMIDALFTTALGRSADAASQAYFEQAIAAGDTRQQIAAQIFASDEYQKQLAGSLLSKFLNRPADSAGIEQFAAQLHAGVTDTEAINQILTSDEFIAQATGT